MTNIKSKNIKSAKQKGGDGYTIDVNRSIGGLMGRSRYSFNYAPIYYGDLLQNGGDNNCGCNTNKENNLYSMLIQSGGVKDGGSQMDAIQYLSNLIAPLGYESLISLIFLIFTYHLFDKKIINTKVKKGGNDVSSILAPLGKSNLIVLASLLLLHHFAIELPNTKKSLKGGSNLFDKINDILKPIGLDKNGISNILLDLQQAFKIKKNNSLNLDENSKSNNNINIVGGNALKNIIAPLGTNAFIASGLLVILAKVLNKDKTNTNDTVNKKGGSKNTNFNKLKNMITPISFSTFANESFVNQLLLNKNSKTKKTIKGGMRAAGRGSGSLTGSKIDSIGSGGISGRGVGQLGRDLGRPINIGNSQRFKGDFDHSRGNIVPKRVGLAAAYLANKSVNDPIVSNVLNINNVIESEMNGGNKIKKNLNKKNTKKNTKK